MNEIIVSLSLTQHRYPLALVFFLLSYSVLYVLSLFPSECAPSNDNHFSASLGIPLPPGLVLPTNFSTPNSIYPPLSIHGFRTHSFSYLCQSFNLLILTAITLQFQASQLSPHILSPTLAYSLPAPAFFHLIWSRAQHNLLLVFRNSWYEKSRNTIYFSSIF